MYVPYHLEWKKKKKEKGKFNEKEITPYTSSGSIQNKEKSELKKMAYFQNHVCYAGYLNILGQT